MCKCGELQMTKETKRKSPHKHKWRELQVLKWKGSTYRKGEGYFTGYDYFICIGCNNVKKRSKSK